MTLIVRNSNSKPNQPTPGKVNTFNDRVKNKLRSGKVSNLAPVFVG